VALLLVVAGVTVVLMSNHRADVAAQERRDAAAAAAAAAAAEKEAEEKARQEAEEKAAQELAAARQTYTDCTSQLGPFMATLKNADARLDVGLTEAQLSVIIGKASVAYHRIDIHDLGRGICLNAGAQLEKAFNQYTASVRQWNDCIFDYGCDTDAITPSLQAKWLKASNDIDRADTILDTLDPDSPRYKPGGAGSNA
jgi:hypothetical protein